MDGFRAITAGAASLYVKVKDNAVRHLNNMGAFRHAQDERLTALHQLPQADTDSSLKQTVNSPEAKSDEPQGKWVDSRTVQRVNQQYQRKKAAIIHSHDADNFTGAWNILTPNEKNNALGFSAITSIVAGGLTYAVAHEAGKPRRRGDKGGKGGNGHECGSCGFGGGHSCGGHGCGHGCGGGCGH